MIGEGLQAAIIVDASYNIENASQISIENIDALNSIRVTTNLPAGTAPAGVTFGSFQLEAGKSYSWSSNIGIKLITIDASGSSAQVTWS